MMASFDSFRQAINAQLEATRLAYNSNFVIEYENQVAVDKGNETAPFAFTRIRFRESEQISVSNPRTRYRGEVQLFFCTKCGTGTKTLYEAAQAFATALQYKFIGGGQLEAARLMPATEDNSWYVLPLMFSFYTDVST